MILNPFHGTGLFPDVLLGNFWFFHVYEEV